MEGERIAWNRLLGGVLRLRHVGTLDRWPIVRDMSMTGQLDGYRVVA